MNTPFAMFADQFNAVLRAIDPPFNSPFNPVAMQAIHDANAEDDAANAYAQANKVARANEYRRDLAKCKAVLKEWLDTPASVASVDDLAVGLFSDFGCDAASALDRGLLELAAQDLFDEHFLGGSP